jgi:alpha-ketoglutarate-dependent taurine dioxygenase
MPIEVRRARDSFAGEVLGADLSRAEDFAPVHRAFLDHGVIVVRDQRLAPEAQIAFSRRFGPLMGRRPSASDKVLMPGFPEITLLSNRTENGHYIGNADAGRYWHSDMSFEENPNLGTVVYAVEIPPDGGDTLFSDLELAYATLPGDLKRRIDGKRTAHTFAKHYREVMARGSTRPPLAPEQLVALKEVWHPAVRTHPETGRKALFVNPGHTTRVEGLGEAESAALLDTLFAHSLRPEHVYRHKWRIGDTVVWDNRRVMHQAETYDMSRYTRHMHRTCIHGDRPF